MQFGAMNFPIKPVLDEIAVIAADGMDYVELAMDPPQSHYSQLHAQRQAVIQALKQHGLGLVCHLPTFVSTADLTESIRKASLQEVLRSLETAAELAAPKVVLHPSPIRGLAIHVLEQTLGHAMDSLDRISRRAGQLGITICIENMFPFYGPFVEPDDFIPIFSAFPHLQFVFDTGHAHMGDPGKHRGIRFIEQYGDRLGHVHVSDNLGQQDDHLPIGGGTIDFKAVARALSRAGYDGTITLEVFSENRSDLIKSRDRLRKMLTKAQEAR